MVNDRQIEVLINDVFDYYGYDFSGYSMASFKRRVERILSLDGITDFTEFLAKIRSEPEYFKRVIEEITVNVTEMFRDPHFYKLLRTQVLPALGAKPFIRIWHAGCSTGEEVFSMAILLKEANLLQKSIMYATDINPLVLDAAKKGVFPLRMMKQYSENYVASGGIEDFSQYYTANYGFAKFNGEFSDKMVFSLHNLVSDRSFNEFDLVLCRNVLIYFDKELQERVLELFDSSLSTLGFLALGTKETIKFSSVQYKFQQLGRDKVWRKIK